MISIIVAVADNRVIGSRGSLPWNLPGEMALFKKNTMGHPIVMGRKTHDSIGRALPGRTNIIISRSSSYQAEGCLVVDSLDKALKKAQKAEGADEIFIIGGESVYAMALPKASKLYLTSVKAKINGDKYFNYDPANWRQISTEKHSSDAKNKYAYEFQVLVRR